MTRLQCVAYAARYGSHVSGARAAAVACVLAVPALRDFFALDLPPLGLDLVIAAVVVIADGLLELGWRAIGHPD